MPKGSGCAVGYAKSLAFPSLLGNQQDRERPPPLAPALQAIVRDITDRKRSELLRDAVYKISQAANTARDLNHLYNEIHKTIISFLFHKFL